MRGEESCTRTEANRLFPCHLQPFPWRTARRVLVCSIFKHLPHQDHQLVRLFHSWGESVTEAAQLGHTGRINTACLFTVWIIHDFWTESKQTAGTPARYRRLLYISGSDRENFDALVMWCDIQPINGNKMGPNVPYFEFECYLKFYTLIQKQSNCVNNLLTK